MEATIEEGSENTRRCHMEYLIVDTDSPPIQRTDEGRIYSSLPTTDRGPRSKRIARKYLYPKRYTLIHIRMARLVYTPYTTILQPPFSKELATR